MIIIITAVGADRPGMVAAMSQILAAQRCNLEDCAMTRLGGQFAMILMVQLPGDLTLAQIEPQFEGLQSSHGLKVHCDEAENHVIYEAKPRHVLTVYAKDRPGLLSKVSQVLAEHNVNITDVQSRLASAGALYVMLFEVEIPASVNADDLKNALLSTQTNDLTVSLRALEEDVL